MKKINIEENLPPELTDLLNDNNIKINYILLYYINGFSLNNEKIYVNKTKNEYQKKFIIAHELGHIVNNHKIRFGVFFNKQNEKEANEFAFEKLLPIDELSEMGEYYQRDLSLLEKYFGIEQEKIEIWINKLLDSGKINIKVYDY